jgi:glycosyltransferase involved in cell wall biosynthesis
MTEVTIVANDVGGIGGMELQLAELVSGLAAAGDSVTVIARTLDERPAGVRFHRVRGPSRPFVIAYPWFALAAGMILRRRARGIVQATGAIVPNRVDLVGLHFCHRGFHERSRASTASRDTALYRTHARISGALARLGESICLRPSRVGRIIAVSPGLAAEVASLYPSMAGRIDVIANGVDRRRFRPATRAERESARTRFRVPSTAPCAAFIGGDWGRKGLAYAVQALREADGWHLLIGGSGDIDAYARLAGNAGVGERVRFLGVVRDPETVYRAADVLLLPSAYETFSLVAYEAAASGLPLLAGTVSGIEDVLDDGVSGFHVAPDPHEIAARLRQLSETPGLGLALGKGARRLTAGYTWTRMVQQHRSLYAAARVGSASR